jgi:hypothetical protein
MGGKYSETSNYNLQPPSFNTYITNISFKVESVNENYEANV